MAVKYNNAGGLLPGMELSRVADNHLQQAGPPAWNRLIS